MASKRTKTYLKHNRSFLGASCSENSDASSSPTVSSESKKRPREEDSDDTEILRVKKKSKTFKASFERVIKPSSSKSSRRTTPAPRKPLTQLVLTLSSAPSIISCKKCGLSYTRGASEDEALHHVYCQRVLQGSEWGREEDRQLHEAGGRIIEPSIHLSNGQCGRIISMRGTVSGRLGDKLETVLSTVNHALSSPPLTREALAASKAYLFLLAPPKSTKERIVGCVVAQHIKTALKVVDRDNIRDPNFIFIDHSVFCDPTPLPTPLGISRVFVTKDYRRLGIAEALLNATTKSFIHGCRLDPERGEVAFSQPTSDGHKLMARWGKGQVRVFEE